MKCQLEKIKQKQRQGAKTMKRWVYFVVTLVMVLIGIKYGEQDVMAESFNDAVTIQVNRSVTGKVKYNKCRMYNSEL